MSPSRETGTAGEIWGHKFVWTAQHPEFEEVHRMLYTYDKLGNDALDRIDALSPPKPKDGTKCPMSQRDLYTLLGEHSKDDGVLGKLWNEVNTVPDWVDWEQIERGQRVVFQYNGQMLLGVSWCSYAVVTLLYTNIIIQLLINSLLGGMAAWRVVETLARTGGFGTQVTRRRLLETSQHFLQCVENVDAVKPGGKGFVSSVRVRLLHATVRRRILELEKKKPGYFNIKEWGIPINDLHQIGTIDAYSTALVFISLPRQGIFLSEQQIADYLALWRWIGYVMGTPVEWMSSVGRAKAMMEVVMTSELDPTRNSQIIANNILTAQANVPPLHASRGYLTALTWRLNGADLSKRLAIAKPSWYHSTLAWVQCLILAANSYRYSHKSAGDQRKQDEVRVSLLAPFSTEFHCHLPASASLPLPFTVTTNTFCSEIHQVWLRDDYEPETRRSRPYIPVRVPVHP